MYFYKIGWLVWIVGTILIVLSWNDTVIVQVGWMGFIIALIGVGLSFIPHIQIWARKSPGDTTSGDDDGTRGA